MVLFLRIIEKLLIIYFTLYFLIDIILYLYSLIIFSRKKIREKPNSSIDYSKYFVTLIIPAYNEEVSIVDCSKMLLELDYPNFEIILVNDGSSDNTINELHRNFEFSESVSTAPGSLLTMPVKKIYKAIPGNLILVDKENGGKADSINAGINYSNGNLICTIDADSILDSNALKEVVKPFILDPKTLVSGGQLAASNDLILKHNKVVSSKTPSNIWVIWQIIEYIKTFMISRLGLSRINSLLIMSGAFSLFKKQDLLEVGGFLTALNKHDYIIKTIGTGKQTVCEDMEIIVRLNRYYRDQKIIPKTVFLPKPVCWTEVPENGHDLFRQRSRWHQGLAETLRIHRKMIFEPKYGMTGLFALPYYFCFELLSPLMKVISLVFIILASIIGIINFQWVILLILSAMIVTAIIMSSITAAIESWSYKQGGVSRKALRYKSFKEWMWLIIAGIIAEFSYSFYKIAAQINGLISFFNKKNAWNKFERKGLKQE